ncbi:MAG TPA: energy transducer TonB [Rhodoferax sp.]|jgi:protein TonB|nr:energy transducer TonB [Rhodoferax sp.]HNV60501.1 energy transducer TonB [Rhodoferax sp.]HPW30962.1 energy transducer TonB [Rhodoferax sp.]
MSRNVRIVIAVLLLHGGALWALQSGLLRRAAELVIPAQVLELSAAEEKPPELRPQPAVKSRFEPRQVPTPMAVAKAVAQPSPDAPAAVVASVESSSLERAPSSSVSPVANAAPPAPTKLELPSTDADYLNNPRPPYPPSSKRMGEQGKVVIRTLIGADGLAQEASIQQSSGFDRLDQAALDTARKWRYVPGKRAGVAEAMWFNVPFTFVLE